MFRKAWFALRALRIVPRPKYELEVCPGDTFLNESIELAAAAGPFFQHDRFNSLVHLLLQKRS